MPLPEIMWMKNSSWEGLNSRKTWHVWCAEMTWCNNDLVKHFHILFHFGLDISDVNSKHLAFLIKFNSPHCMVKCDGINHIVFFTSGCKTRVGINHDHMYHAISNYLFKNLPLDKWKNLKLQKTGTNMWFPIIPFIFCMYTYQEDIPVLQLLACRMGHSFPWSVLQRCSQHTPCIPCSHWWTSCSTCSHALVLHSHQILNETSTAFS